MSKESYIEHGNFYIFPCITQILTIMLVLKFHDFFLIGFETATMISGIFLVFFIKNFWGVIHNPSVKPISKPYMIKTEDLPKNQRKIYLGKGFIWSTKLLQQFFSMNFPVALNNKSETGGNAYLHALGQDYEKQQFLKNTERNGHTSLCGTTRVGKTRGLELFTTQDLRRGETVIILDPKGDNDLVDRVYSECVKIGRKNDFKFFSLIHPHKSHTFNPIASYLKPTDIASRITGMLPSDPKSKPFTDFCWSVLVDVITCMELADIPVTLKSIQKYTLTNMEILFQKMSEKFGVDLLAQFMAEVGAHKKKDAEPVPERLNLMGYSEEESDAIWETAKKLFKRITHPSDNFSKMTNSLEPVLASLTFGEIGDLLSPVNPVITWKDIIENKRVVYFYLGAMVDYLVATNIARLTIQDFLFHIGMSYGTNKAADPINLYIDEVYNVVYEGIVNLLNKTGGAGVRCTIAMQTLSDLESVIDKAKAAQIIGNTNNKICMRVVEREVAESFSKMFGTLSVKQIMKTQASTPLLGDTYSSNYGERLMDKDMEVVRPEWLMSLPKGEAFVFTQGKAPLKIKFPLFSNAPEYPFMRRITAIKSEDELVSTERGGT